MGIPALKGTHGILQVIRQEDDAAFHAALRLRFECPKDAGGQEQRARRWSGRSAGGQSSMTDNIDLEWQRSIWRMETDRVVDWG